MPKISQLPPEENPTPDDEFVMVDKALGITKKVTGDNISGAFGDESIGIEKIKNLSTSLNVDGTLKSIVEADYSNSNGYIRYSNGRQEAWKIVTKPSGDMEAWGSIYYSEQNAGSWGKGFTSIDMISVAGLSSSVDGWVGSRNATNTSAGSVRFFRPTNGTGTMSAVISARGTWS